MGRHSADCERAHLWVSLDLDDEITELERSSLRAHLRSCPPCAGYARQATQLALALREAPQVASGRPVRAALAPARRARTPLRLAASVAAIVAALALGGLAGTLSSGGGGTSPQADAVSHRLLIQQSLLALMAGSAGKRDSGGRVIPS